MATSAQPIAISCRGLSKAFGPREAEAAPLLAAGATAAEVTERTACVVGLRDVSFDVPRGSVLVVMGLSGSGKSTTLRCINRLIEPTAGTVVVGGTDVTALSQKDLLAFRRTAFGMVFQNFALFPHRSIRANVEYGLEIQGIAPAARRDKAMAAIEQVGLKGWDAAFPAQLSGGMQQRAGLARALAADAEILLMDEAFSALDPLIRRDMQAELVELQHRLHKTILFVSHDLDEAIALGGRIVLMRNGSIVQAGTAKDFLLAPADDYVARFVQHIDVLEVLTVEAAMTPLAGPAPEGGAWLARSVTLGAALDCFKDAATQVTITDDAGAPIGTVDEAGLVAVLARQRRAARSTAHTPA